MNLSLNIKAQIVAASILSIVLFSVACSSSPVQPTTPDEPVAPPEVVISPSDNSSTQAQDDSTTLPKRVDVVYFHRPQRCPTCLCFEERIRYVMSTYFQKELDSGRMTFGVYNIGDSKNADIVKKYNAVGSQLFINIVEGDTDHIYDIQAIWDWNCRGNKLAFDQRVKAVIEQSLGSEE